jgi:hypothetical protein
MSAPLHSVGTKRGRLTLGRVTGCVVAALITLVPAAATGGSGAGAGRKVCIRVWKEAPYRSLGYDHFVAIHNGCQRALRCTVTTNASPGRYAVSVDPNRTVRVLTFRGAPRRQFAARVQCRAAE